MTAAVKLENKPKPPMIRRVAPAEGQAVEKPVVAKAAPKKRVAKKVTAKKQAVKKVAPKKTEAKPQAVKVPEPKKEKLVRVAPRSAEDTWHCCTRLSKTLAERLKKAAAKNNMSVNAAIESMTEMWVKMEKC